MEISDNVDLQKLNRNRLQNVLKNRLGRNDNKIDVIRGEKYSIDLLRFGGITTWNCRTHIFNPIWRDEVE